jgi:hypothetical protein
MRIAWLFVAATWACGSDGDKAAGDDSTSADDSATNPKVDHAACDDYLLCLKAVAPSQVGPALEAYGSEGACWDSQENAELCNSACAAAMEKLSALFPDEKACGQTASPSTPESIDVEWTADQLRVTMVGGTGTLDFGITEVGVDAWQAESCTDDTTVGFGPYCHEVAADDSTNIDCVDVPHGVDDDSTLFCYVAVHLGDDSLTYYLGAPDHSWCAVRGANPEYYAGLDCEEW